MTPDELHAALQEFVGQEVGPPQRAPDEVNVPMVRHWCEAIGDTNPAYLDADAAAASVHGGLVAPPTMLQAWVMNGLAGPDRNADSPYERMNQLLFSHGFTSVVATNCEQTYVRYLRPGDRLTMRTVIDSISPQKETALGTGHFVTTRQDYFDADGELVGSMLFRIIRFRPRPKAPARPPRPRPATTHDNQWWFDALNEGRLQVQRCTDCGLVRHPAGPMCPSCHSLSWTPVDVGLTGEIHSYVITHFPQVPSFEYPLPVVLVDLEAAGGEPVRMVMNTADTEHDRLAIGAKVRVEIRPVDPEMSLPFAIVEESQGDST
jgi:uncharacterized OB-fold protein/acyl dehydratase